MIPSYVTPVLVTGIVTTIPSGTQDVNIISPNPLPTEDINIEKSFGTWGYISGIDGTVVVSGTKRIIGIGVYSFLGGYFTINGGDTITIPAGVTYNIEPKGNIIDPTFVFTGTNTYLIETVS